MRCGGGTRRSTRAMTSCSSTPASIAVEQQDFVAALTSITPASHRSAAAHARCGAALSMQMSPRQLAAAAAAPTTHRSCLLSRVTVRTAEA